MLNKLINILIILSLSLIGADRINLLTDSFEYFVFSPFLFFSFLLVFLLVVYKNHELDFQVLGTLFVGEATLLSDSLSSG